MRFLALTALLFGWIPFSLAAQDSKKQPDTKAEKSWVGQRIIVKGPGSQIGYTDEKGNQVYLTKLSSIGYAVIAEQGGFLQVNHRGHVGWFPKDQAMLVDDAIAYFTERVRISSPKDSFPLAYLGWAYREKKQHDQAVKAYDQALAQEARADWFNNRGVIQMEMGRLEHALNDFTAAVQRAPDFTMARENRATALARLKQFDSALTEWQEVLKREPKNAFAFAQRARVHVAKKDLDKAIVDLTQAIDADPENPAFRIERAHIRADLKQWDHVFADLAEAIKLDAKNPILYLQRANMQSERKEFGKALEDLNHALKLLPEFYEARVARGWNYFLTAKYAEAEKDFAAALKQNPNATSAYNLQAWMWATCPDAKHRDGVKAIEYAKKAVDLSAGKEIAYLDTLAAAHAEAGQFDDAVKVQEGVVAAVQDDADYRAEVRERLDLYRKKMAYRQAK